MTKSHPFIIAEIGSNYDGDINKAYKLIEVAKESGADAVKFQLFKAESLYPDLNSDAYRSTKKVEMDRAIVSKLKLFSDQIGIEFSCSAFDIEALNLLKENNVSYHKIASSEIRNLELVAKIAALNKTTFISTGMAAIADIAEAVEVFESISNQSPILMHCVSVYPTEFKDANLSVMQSIGNAFGCDFGLSDHSLGISLPIASTALGCSVIEKHITLDKNSNGPDHFYALEPYEFEIMCRSCKEVSSAIGDAKKKFHPDELSYGRLEGAYAARDIQSNEILSEYDLEMKRPALGIRARYRSLLVGVKTANKVEKGKPIEWKDLSF